MKKIIIMMVLIIGIGYANYIPQGFYVYKDILDKEVDKYFPYDISPGYFPALIEHESCITLKHSRCWNPKSRLKTSREEGAGLSQLTRAYRTDGTIRFDTIANLKKQHPRDLKELNWDNVYDRADLQIRAMILLWKSNYRYFNNKGISKAEIENFADAAYNAGAGNIYKDMTLCKMKKDCNQFIWFDNVEKACNRNKILYGNRSACDINRHHVTDVMINNKPKYEEEYK